MAYNDYLIGPYINTAGTGWTGTPLKSEIDQLIEIRRQYAGGEMRSLTVNSGVQQNLFVLQRVGNTEKSGCILVLNNHGTSTLSSSVQTGWPNKILTDLISNTTVTTDSNGSATLGALQRGYRIYVPTGDVP